MDSSFAPPECCPNARCHTRLVYFESIYRHGRENILPDGLYCPICHDVIYDFDGNEIAKL